MNCVYFACTDCQIYVDAGYRWCYWELEHPGIVHRGERVSFDALLAHEPYWNPPEGERSKWLCEEILPTVRRFIEEHRGHNVVYWESEQFPDDYHFTWLEVGIEPFPSPRFFVETLKMTNWNEVVRRREATGHSWGNEEHMERFRQSFEQLLARRRSDARD